MLKEVFISLVSEYTEDKEYVNSLWDQIFKNHSKENRYYHNLSHLENVYKHLRCVKKDIFDWDMTLFSLFYHDYVYNILKKNNEERSAQKAIEVLYSLPIKSERIELCKEIIIATQGHQISKINDINYFTDADLSILGSSWQDYKMYFEQVRKEYINYPDFIYRKGRIKVLQQFINMPRIFKTHYFYDIFENQAKKNLQKEIILLSK